LQFIRLFILVAICAILFFTREKSYYPYDSNETKLYDTSLQVRKLWFSDLKEYPQDEIELGRKLAKEEMHILQTDSVNKKVIKIGAFLCASFLDQLGQPADSLFAATPWQQFVILQQGDGKLFCTQFSDMFTFFCRIQNITTRQIESKNDDDRHIFNEVYLDEEAKWVYVDLKHNIIFPTKNERPLTLIDLTKQLHETKKNAFTLSVESGKVVHHSLEDCMQPLRTNYGGECKFYYYVEENLKTMKHPIQKLSKYLLNKPMVLVLNHHESNFMWFVLKYLLLMILPILAWQFVAKFRKQ